MAKGEFLCVSVALWFIYMCAMPEMSRAAAAAPLLVFDGDCGFCARSVQFILKHERSHDLRFVPRESPLGKDIRHRFHLEAVESMLWVDGDSVAVESGAVLQAARYLGGVWSALATLGLIVPASLRNWAYRLIARNRRRLSSAATSCLLPTPEQQSRFLS